MTCPWARLFSNRTAVECDPRPRCFVSSPVQHRRIDVRLQTRVHLMKSYPISFARATAARASLSHSATYSGPRTHRAVNHESGKDSRALTTEPLRIFVASDRNNSGDASPMLSTVVDSGSQEQRQHFFPIHVHVHSATPGIRTFPVRQ